MNNKIKILIVDDSAFMRKSLEIMLKDDPEFEIVGKARDGIEAIDFAKRENPDLITMDVEMPKMDGLKALEIIMKECPTSVIMVSSLTSEGADATLRALELGAVDFIPKELSFVNVNIISIKDELRKKIKAIVHKQRCNRNNSISKTAIVEPKRTVSPSKDMSVIAVGISTGGPVALQKIIPQLSENLKFPIIIVQHMPPKFTALMANRLNATSKIKVKEAKQDEIIQPGTVYIAQGGKQLLVSSNSSNEKIFNISMQPETSVHKPSVDVMLNSVVDNYGNKALGIIMTGMGRDGLEGMKRLKSAGGFCVAQDEKSSVIYGMPKAIVDNGIADYVLSLYEIPEFINNLVA